MKAIKLIITLLIFIQVSAQAEEKRNPSPSVIKMKFSSVSQKDTAAINAFVRKGTKYLSSKENNLDIVKECIDSAVLICEKMKIDVPARLHLLLAQYHYVTGDLRSASEEASLALKKSAGSGEPDVLARTNIFLGRYYLRTGFFAESLEYFDNAITISKKEKLKGIIPMVYFGKYEVYRTIGDLKAERQSLQMMIDAAYDENNSALAGRGYERLGYSYLGDTTTSERRNFRMADSIVRKSISVSAEINDTSLIATSLTHLGWNFYLEKMYDSSIYYYEKSIKYSCTCKFVCNISQFTWESGYNIQ